MPYQPYQFKIQPRDSVLRLAEAMEEALRANEHRGAWANVPVDKLVDSAMTAMDELDFAQANLTGEAVAHHAVTVANYMMMIKDNANGQ